MAPCRPCPDCGQSRRSKGYHDLSIRTVFGHLTVKSPRLHHCECGSHETSTFSPLAALLPDHTTPELLFLETKWASLMSYGMTAKLLEDVLPMDDPLNAFDGHICSLFTNDLWIPKLDVVLAGQTWAGDAPRHEILTHSWANTVELALGGGSAETGFENLRLAYPQPPCVR